jgi:ABC-type sugar transport system permease subunit
MDMTNAVDAGIFKSESGKPLNVKSFAQSKAIKLQENPSASNETFTWIIGWSKIIGLILICFSLFLNLFFTASLYQTIQWLTSMQMILHLPMLSLIVPPVVLTFFTAWMTIGKFDILNTDIAVESQDWFFNYN